MFDVLADRWFEQHVKDGDFRSERDIKGVLMRDLKPAFTGRLIAPVHDAAGGLTADKEQKDEPSDKEANRLDLHLVHWRGSVPLDHTVVAMEVRKRVGKIRHWGAAISTLLTWWNCLRRAAVGA